MALIVAATMPTRPAKVRDRDMARHLRCFDFDSREIRDAFSAAVIRALLEFAPTVFEDT
jgi:hypothetical protein